MLPAHNPMTQDLLSDSLRLFLGSAGGTLLQGTEHLSSSDLGFSTLLSAAPSENLIRALRKNGYARRHSFVVIPSRSVPRWLVPIGEPAETVAGTRIYEPHMWGARLIKKLLVSMFRAGWRGWPYSNVVLASKERSALDTLVSEVTGEPRPVFALSLGRQPAVRKLTIQVMRPGGQILGYIKTGLVPSAIERVRAEARSLERLSCYPRLRSQIPRLLHAGKVEDTYVLFQSALYGSCGPTRFGAVHDDFLNRLSQASPSAVPARKLVGDIAIKWASTLQYLGEDWPHLGNEALRRSSEALTDAELRCGIVHGDFAPWNTRIVGERLLCFDWESAAWDAPLSWDAFHFHITSARLNRQKKLVLPRSEMTDEGTFILYLLKSVMQFVEEKNETAVRYYRILLLNAFRGEQVWVECPGANSRGPG